MTAKRFENLQNRTDIRLIDQATIEENNIPRWTISPETKEMNEAIDENIRLSHHNVAKSAARYR